MSGSENAIRIPSLNRRWTITPRRENAVVEKPDLPAGKRKKIHRRSLTLLKIARALNTHVRDLVQDLSGGALFRKGTLRASHDSHHR